ncbi:MAG: NfeD family protein [Pseudonocardia sp.]|nr:NfeD family protein [Pseudonocardia sp.]
MTPVVFWLIVGLALVAAEVLSGEFVLLMLGGGALAAAGVSLFVISPVAGVVTFALASLVLVFAVRPALRRRLEHQISDGRMHHRALEGREGVVVARVDGDGGRVKIGGELWSARPVDADDVIDEGAVVLVVEIKGATAVVVGKD